MHSSPKSYVEGSEFKGVDGRGVAASRNAYKIQFQNLKGRNLSGDLAVDRKIKLKSILSKTRVCGYGLH